jgi:hypothetical protein
MSKTKNIPLYAADGRSLGAAVGEDTRGEFVAYWHFRPPNSPAVSPSKNIFLPALDNFATR